MNEIQIFNNPEFMVVRIEPEDLPQDRAFILSRGYNMDLSDFVVSIDLNSKTIWVNQSVPENDIAKFIETVNFPFYYVGDRDMGMGEFLEYVYDRYGYGTYHALIKAHSERRKRERAAIAKECITKLIPLFHKKAEEIDIDEALLYAAHSAGYAIDSKTPENLISYGDEFVFLLGYLMGNGTVTSELMGKAVQCGER